MKAHKPAETAKARLKRAEILSSEAQRIAGVGTWQFDTRSGLVVWSKELFRIFGVSPTKFQPTQDSFLACVHPEDREQMMAVISDTIGGKPMDTIHRIVRPNGEIRHIHGCAQVVLLEKGGDPILVGTVQDITERRRAEEVISAQTARLEQMQAKLIYVARQSAMGTMAATLAHELNQPLTAIYNYAVGLRRTMSPDKTTREALEQIEKNTGRAGEIIRHLREITRRGSTEQARIDVGLVIRGASILVTQGTRAQVAVEYRVEGNQFVVADPIQIGQVVINLVKNACEAVGDSINKKVLIETAMQGDDVRVAITDSGPGIAPDLISTLFEGGSSVKPDGMGIGLSICRTIVESYQGKIGAENLPGGGARVWFTLPLDAVAE